MIGQAATANQNWVLMFKTKMRVKRSSEFSTQNIKVQKGPLKKATIGAHKGYYRVVLSLDGNYHYAIRQSGNGYTLTLR